MIDIDCNCNMYHCDIAQHDIENDIESDIHLYADDTALVESFSRSEEDEAFSLLNRDLQKLDEWSHTTVTSYGPSPDYTACNRCVGGGGRNW